MKNPYLIILLIASLTSTLAQDCNNPLLGIYGLTSLGSPQSGAGLSLCPNLQSAQTCCSADTINSFQGRLDGFINNLNLYDAARDLYIAQLRNRFFESFQDLLNSIDDNNLDANLAAIREVNDTLADQLQSEISTFTQLNADAQNVSNNFSSVLDDFQVARNNCFAAALQVQASSWCLACDPNYATRGVNSDGTVTFGDSLCQQINDACLPYFDQSARFNPLINARAAYWRLQAVAAYLNNFADTNQVEDFIVPQDPFNPLPSQLNVTVPAQWAAGGTEQCSNLWASDQNLAGLLRIGNSVPTVTNAGTRLLQNSLAGAAGVWTPDLSVIGLSLSGLSNDPGDYFGVSDYSDLNLNEFENGEGEIDVDDNPDIIVINNRST